MKDSKQINVTNNKHDYGKDPNLTGINGWLVVLLVYICIALFFGIVNSWNSFSNNDLNFSSIIRLAVLVLYVIAIVAIAQRKEFLPRYLTANYVLSALFSIVVLIIMISNYSPRFSDEYATYYLLMIIALGIDIVSMILWIIYLNKSERVYNTFM